MILKGFRSTLYRGWLAIIIASIFLVSCGLNSATEVITPDLPSVRHDYIFQVEIDSTNSRESLENKYKSEIIVYKPQAGFAILVGSESNHLAQQNVLAEDNVNSISAPVLDSGSAAWSSSAWSSSAWSSSAWSSSAWSSSAWSSGAGQDINDTGVALPPNQAIWQQVELYGAHSLTSKLGQDITVAVIDSGIDPNHILFTNKLSPTTDWYDFVDGDSNPSEVGLSGAGHGHGTGVAGVVIQVAPNINLLPLRALSANGSGDMDDVILAIDHAITVGADIINLSLGSDVSSTVLENMIAYAKSQGVYVVAAVGNAGQNIVDYPAKLTYLDEPNQSAIDFLFSIGSVTLTDELASFSNHGSETYAFAPGEQIATAYPGNMYFSASGTSFSTPMVAGSLALALAEIHPSEKGNLATHFLNSLSDIGSGFYNGRLNVNDLVAAAIATN